MGLLVLRRRRWRFACSVRWYRALAARAANALYHLTPVRACGARQGLSEEICCLELKGLKIDVSNRRSNERNRSAKSYGRWEYPYSCPSPYRANDETRSCRNS